MSYQDIPNLLSILRIVLIIPIVGLLYSQQFVYALIVFAIAGLTDGFDGLLAKRYHWQSRLGTILDPLADKLLLISSFASLTYLELIPLWLLVLVCTRDIMIVTGGLAYHYFVSHFDLTPLWSSKVNTVAQILLVLIVILQQCGVAQLAPAINAGIWLVTASVLISGAEYILVWGIRAWNNKSR